MQAIIIMFVITFVLFVFAFISKRRLGVIGLSLAAGLVLSEVWAYELSLIAGIFRLGSDAAGMAIIKSLVIILPSLILMIHGGKYKTAFGRITGALLYTILALAFLIEPMRSVLSIDGSMADAYMRFVNQKDLVIGAGLILATLDVFMIKHAPKDKEKKGRH